MMVLVCGLSDSGKSTLISKSNVADFGIHWIRASELLSEANRPTSGLNADDVAPNQQVLVAKLLALSRATDILLDGHLLIETSDGPQLVPDRCMTSLPLRGIIFVEANMSELLMRRAGSNQPLDVDSAREMVELERIQGRRVARLKRVEFQTVGSADITGFRDMLRSLVA